MREESEFNYIFRLYYSQLFHFAMQYVDDEDDARDLVSATYEDVWRNFANINAETVKSFLYTNVRNKCIDFLRRGKCHARYLEFVTMMSDDFISGEHFMEYEDNMRLIQQTLECIGPPTKEILMACYVDGKKYKEVASEMNISISTVKKHMVKALKIIREKKSHGKA